MHVAASLCTEEEASGGETWLGGCEWGQARRMRRGPGRGEGLGGVAAHSQDLGNLGLTTWKKRESWGDAEPRSRGL